VAALPNVDIVAGTEVIGLRSNGERLTGVRLSDTVDVAADLVVDASGRSNRGPAWLAELGYPEVAEDVVRANLVYVTREYRRVPGEQDFTGIIHSHYPDNPVGSGTLATDGRRWIVTMLGLNDDHPSTAPGEFEQFAKRLAGTELYELITTAEPLTEPTRFRIGPSARRRYDKAQRLPEGFVVIGDALCCFNPAYGQGMTTAAMTAKWLQECLRSGTEGLTRRYFRGVRKIIDVPWAITVGNDLRFPSVEGPRTVQMRVLNAYLARLHRAAARDSVVGGAFLRVANFLAPPPSLLAPRMMWRVWRGQRAVRSAAIAQPSTGREPVRDRA
jgi:2-polyprenyl-6-methoxyphenol hydroxylase-like FAD-dependent oxidoreductase